MKAEMIELIDRVGQVLLINRTWMTWNLFLAFIPLAISFWLFCSKNGRAWVWWLGFLTAFSFVPPNSHYLKSAATFLFNYLSVRPLLFTITISSIPIMAWFFTTRYGRNWLWWILFVTFYAFLPNAPYLLTDVIHLIDDIRTIHSVWMITLVLIPLYVVVILAGLQAYVISLINFGNFLQRIDRSKLVLPMELITHALCAIGIFLGRFLRFNTWDLITAPDALLTKVVEDVLGRQPLVIIAITFFVLTGLYWIMKRVTLGFLRRSHNKMNQHERRINPNSPAT